MNTNGNDDHLPEYARRNARQMMPRNGSDEVPEAEGLNSHKAVLGVVFIDEKGETFSMQNSHLYRCFRDGDDLVAEFSGHRVILSGRGLFAPVHSSLLMMLTLHKRDLVTALVGGDARDFGQSDGKTGWTVTAIRVEPIEEK